MQEFMHNVVEKIRASGVGSWELCRALRVKDVSPVGERIPEQVCNFWEFIANNFADMDNGVDEAVAFFQKVMTGDVYRLDVAMDDVYIVSLMGTVD